MRKIKIKRLPPQPTDTALARLVARILERLPLVTIKERNALKREAEAAHREMHHMQEAIWGLSYRTAAGAGFLKQPEAVDAVADDRWTFTDLLTLRVNFGDYNAHVMIPRRQIQACRASDEAMKIIESAMRDASMEVAMLQSKTLAGVIYARAMASLKIADLEALGFKR